jgi:hypothetical protein
MFGGLGVPDYVIYYRCIGDKSRKIAMNPEMEENPIRFQAKNDIL